MKKQLLMSLILVGSVLSAMSVKADDTTAAPNTMSSDLSKLNQEQKPANKDIDDEITNARLRAVTGSKSNWSFWSQFAYAGSSIMNPLSTQRPQLNSQNNADPTNLGGQVSAKYRLTEHDSLLAGIGVQFTPQYSDPKTHSTVGAQTTAQTPYVDYNRAFRLGGVQNVVDVAVSKYTLSSDLDSNMNYGWSIAHQMMVETGKSGKLSLGLYEALGQDIYTHLDPGQALAGNPNSVIYAQFAVDPVLEYAFTDKVSFRTVYRMLTLNDEAYNRSIWKAAPESQSVGIGYAVTRDIYLYPNMQWAWGHVATDQTTVGLTANVNL